MLVSSDEAIRAGLFADPSATVKDASIPKAPQEKYETPHYRTPLIARKLSLEWTGECLPLSDAQETQEAVSNFLKIVFGIEDGLVCENISNKIQTELEAQPH